MGLILEVKQLIDVITDKTIFFLDKETGLKVISTTFDANDPSHLDLKRISSLISIGGSFNAYVVFSFDRDLIFQIFKNYTKELDLVPEEQAADIEETAGEMLNIIIGNSLTPFQKKGEAIHCSPPIIISEAKRIMQYRDAKFFQSALQTAYGTMKIFLVGPKELFDTELDHL